MQCEDVKKKNYSYEKTWVQKIQASSGISLIHCSVLTVITVIMFKPVTRCALENIYIKISQTSVTEPAY